MCKAAPPLSFVKLLPQIVMAEAKELLMIHNLAKVKDLEEKSQRDGLTGAYNRLYFDDTLRREFNLSAQYNLPLTVAIIDLDYFKQNLLKRLFSL